MATEEEENALLAAEASLAAELIHARVRGVRSG